MKKKQMNEINMTQFIIYFSIFSSFLIKKEINNDFYKEDITLYNNMKYIVYYSTLIYYIKKRYIVEYI